VASDRAAWADSQGRHQGWLIGYREAERLYNTAAKGITEITEEA
jgi:hypothetical protein